jgi:putative colanic acid biosynthesis UDP-glucose lipid carrier transferase
MSKLDKEYKSKRIVIDLLLIIICFIFTNFISETTISSSIFYISLLILISLWLFASYFSSIYGDRRAKKFSEELIYIFYTFLLYLILLSTLSIVINHYYQNPLIFFATYFISFFPTLITIKYIFRKYIHRKILNGDLYESVLIIGLTTSGLDYLDTINKYYYFGYRCIGYLDNSKSIDANLEYHGSLSNIKDVLTNLEIDEVVIALSHSETKQIQLIMEYCDFYNVKVKILPDFNQYTLTSAQVNNIGTIPVLNVIELPLDKVENKLFKRIIDIIGVLIFTLFIGFWLIPIIALLVKFSSKGPILFKQERWGLNNQKIICYKFRSMFVESNDVTLDGQYNQARKDDIRVTLVGKFLRKNNLDELPQFWNVLLGNMSIVGPRPHPVKLNFESMHSVQNYMLRHIVLPGITGWAQVNGHRGETKEKGSMQKRINYDLYYIHNWTIWLDFQIILQTIINLFRGDQNAY